MDLQTWGSMWWRLVTDPFPFFKKLSDVRPILNCFMFTILLVFLNVCARALVHMAFGSWQDVVAFVSVVFFGVLFSMNLLLGFVVAAAILNILLKLFDAKPGYTDSLLALAYGFMPVWLLGWIPVKWVAGIAVVWAVVLQTIGMLELKEMTLPKAVLGIVWVLIADLYLTAFVATSAFSTIFA